MLLAILMLVRPSCQNPFDGSDDDQTVPSNPDLLTQTDDILQPCLSCHPQHHCPQYWLPSASLVRLGASLCYVLHRLVKFL